MITQLIISALFVTGLHTLCRYEEGQDIMPDYAGGDWEIGHKRFTSRMPLWFLSYYSRKWIGEYWSKPLFTCNVCMSSFWGIVLYSVFFILNNKLFEFETIISCTIFIIALTGINKIIYERYIG